MKYARISAFLVIALLGFSRIGAATPLVDADWLHAKLGKPGLVVLDIRNKIDGGSRQVFEAGHIPGAVYSNYLTDGWRATSNGVPGMLPPTADLARLIGGLGIGNSSHVVIVPGGVSALDYGSATRVYWTFKVLGHDAVSILDGGYAEWTRSAARPVETGPSKASPATFTADFRPELLATGEDVKTALAKGTALIDNRPPEQFSGQSKHPKAVRAGTIPGAVNVPQDRFFDGKTGRFASLEKLSSLWTDQDVADDSEQIAFCNTGHWASLGWFAAHELMGNRKARMYDGSMTDWTARADRPVANGAQSAKK